MPEPSAVPAPPSSRTWRRCLLLCLPALVLGAILRLSLLTLLPEGYYGPDSNSYFDTASDLWLHHEFEVGPKRRWVYPILLTATPLLPGRNIATIAVAQHILGLLTIFGIGWIVLHLTKRPSIWVPVVTTIAAVWPRMVWYEHEVIAECLLLFSIVLAIALVFPIETFKSSRRLFWFLMAAALIVAVKPHGRPIWLALMISAVLLAGLPWRWSKACWAALAVSLAVILTTGSSKQGPWLLLSSTFPLVDTEHGKWPEYRALLKPHIEEARVDITQYAWKQDRYKKMLTNGPDDKDGDSLGPEWQALLNESKKKTKFLKVCNDLAKDAIIHHPFTYAGMILRKIGMVLSDDQAGWLMIPKVFWRSQLRDNEDRWVKHPDEMKLLYELDHDGYLALAAERSAHSGWYERHIFNFAHTFSWMRTIRTAGKRTLHPAWFGLLAFFGFLTCLRPNRWRETAPLWLSLGLFLGLIFAIGDSVSRYLQPVDWIGIVFVGLGLDWALQWVWPVKERVPDTPASDPIAAPVS